MFIGREKELEVLERLYGSGRFEYLVLYGRRRIGKTELLKEFSKRHRVLFYSALEKRSNLSGFGACVLSYFGVGQDMRFQSWKDCFDFIGANSTNGDRIVVVIDEFPYVAREEKEVKSVLQHEIDHLWKDLNIFLILCGSSVSFMVDKVMGKKTPLYGRNTSVMELTQLDYLAASGFLPGYSPEEKLIAYGILGGVPYYLRQFDDRKSIEENIAERIVESSSVLRNEPLSLLKAEVREPATYNSIIEVIANGATKLTEISDKVGMASTKVSVYLKNLQQMRVVEKIIPCGDKSSTRRSQYVLADNFFNFWYRFIFSQSTRIELMEPLDFVRWIRDGIFTYMGLRFEGICLQFIRREARRGNLPFIPDKLGKWWGGNQRTRKPEDIDVLGISGNRYIFCECKFKSEVFDLGELKDLETASEVFLKAKEKHLVLFSKSGFTDAVVDECRKLNARLVRIEDML